MNFGNPAIASVVMETSKPNHIIDNMIATYGEFTDQATRKKMANFVLSLPS